jgi:NADPH-dependent 2,4-dienoyl-CoA reductase/sulfur reductase-like enzyme/nitrite reductase/ring-hydroxylating ferredoxin subunit
MGSDQSGVSGPDLGVGVSLASLIEGKPLLGHVGDEAVMLVKRGGEVYAVSATCTHYSGPLAEGLIVDDTVRCPLHHACFDLRTGEPLRAPALNPIACYQVEHLGANVRVGAKLVVPRKTRPPGDPGTIVIVGAGAAGNAAAETLRREGFSGKVVLVGRESDVPYDRPNLSKDYLAGTAPDEWMPLRSPEWYREQGIDLLLGAAAQKIDPQGRTVTLASGQTLAWDRLLLATGADPVRLTVPGAELPHVRTLRSMADCKGIIAALAPDKRVVIVGASFIGMEAAAALRTRKIPVEVVAPEAVPFERTLGREVGEFLRAVHAGHGVGFRLGARVTSIDERGVTLDKGGPVPADLVLAGIGVRPSLELAEQAGLTVDRGVTVDRYLQTSAPGIFAAGDAARWPDPHSGQNLRVEHWVVAERMGQTAARNMLGAHQPFEAVPFFWTHHYDLSLSYVGHAERWDRVDIGGTLESRNCRVVYRGDHGRPLAVLTIERNFLSLRVERAYETGGPSAVEGLV